MITNSNGFVRSSEKSPEDMEALIHTLEGKDGLARQHAREALVTGGKAAVPRLIQLLEHPREQARWEAAKALKEIADPASATALIAALQDKDSDVRWVAAEGLVALGESALQPLLAALTAHSHSTYLQEGAHHILHELRDSSHSDKVTEVLASLRSETGSHSISFAAHAALEKIKNKT